MALLERVGTLLRANLNDLVDRAEDPEKMLKQVILDMDNQLMQVKTQVAISLADLHLLERRRDENTKKGEEWMRKAGLAVPQSAIRDYPVESGFIAALAESIRETFAKARPGLRYRLLLSAHGLPERVVAKGDPYQRQVEQTCAALVRELGMEGLDWTICYQSRVGPLKWIGPATDAEIVRAGREGLGLVVAPIAFVSEHAETLVELDIEYAKLAQASGAADYLRAPAVGTRKPFIDGLAGLVARECAR